MAGFMLPAPATWTGFVVSMGGGIGPGVDLVALGAAAVVIIVPAAQAVGATKDPDSKGLYPRQPA